MDRAAVLQNASSSIRYNMGSPIWGSPAVAGSITTPMNSYIIGEPLSSSTPDISVIAVPKRKLHQSMMAVLFNEPDSEPKPKRQTQNSIEQLHQKDRTGGIPQITLRQPVQLLSVGSSNIEDLFDGLSPPLKQRGVPRVNFTRNGHLLSIENIVTPNGFGKVNIAKIKSYSDKQQNEAFQTLLKHQMYAFLQQKNTKTPVVSMFNRLSYILTQQLAKCQDPLNYEKMRSEQAVWTLCDILWPRNVLKKNDDDDGVVLEQYFRLSNWLKSYKNILFPRHPNSKNSVYDLLQQGKTSEACDLAIATNNHWLSLIIATGTSSDLDFDLFEEIDDNCFPNEFLQTINLCNGNIEALEDIAVSSLYDYDWLHFFALYLWHRPGSLSLSVEQAIRTFEKMLRKVTNTDDDCQLPKYCQRSVSNLCVQLLKMYSCTGYRLETLFDPKVCTNDLLDYKLSYFLMLGLSEKGYQVDSKIYLDVCISFAGQLEQVGMVDWMMFVINSSTPPDEVDDLKARRSQAVVKTMLVEKYLANEQPNLELEKFVVEFAGVSKDVLYRAKASRARQLKRYDQMIGYHLKLNEFQLAFNSLKTYLDIHGLEIVGIGPQVSENVACISRHVQTLIPFKKKIIGWEEYGLVIVNFLKLKSQPMDKSALLDLISAISKIPSVTHVQW